MRTVLSRPRSSCDWHSHAFWELCLAADGASRTGKAGRFVPAPAGTLFFYPPGERHGYWNDARLSPRFWVLHFVVDPREDRALTFLRDQGPAAGWWSLSPAQVATFRTLYLRIFREHADRKPLGAQAESAWLRLLLVETERWSRPQAAVPASPLEVTSPELMHLWQLVNECASRPAALAARIRAEVPNYDSLRHSFKAAFGQSPGRLLLQLRLQQAKNLLLETSLSIKEIADQLGYARQHEFARAFRRVIGDSPTGWRENPLPEE